MMSSVMKVLIVLLCAALIGTTLYAQHTRLTQVKEQAEWAEQDLLRQQTQLATLQEVIKSNQQLLSSLQHKQRQIHTTLSEREQHLDQLIQHNAAAQSWATSALPDTITQLLQRPAFLGAGAYMERLSVGDTVPSSTVCSTNEPGTGANLESNGSGMGNVCSAD